MPREHAAFGSSPYKVWCEVCARYYTFACDYSHTTERTCTYLSFRHEPPCPLAVGGDAASSTCSGDTTYWRRRAMVTEDAVRQIATIAQRVKDPADAANEAMSIARAAAVKLGL